MSSDEFNPLSHTLTLGKTVSYTDKYQPELLQAVPRSFRPDHSSPAPFPTRRFGADIWTLYELSWLDENGLPHVATGQVVVPADSPNLIESKSFKLYLNSFNQTVFASPTAVAQTLTRDLSACAASPVQVSLFTLDALQPPIVAFSGQSLDQQDLRITAYDYTPQLLTQATDAAQPLTEETVYSHLLKSNCLITHQPDWGSIQIAYRGPRIDHAALLRYLVSFRQHSAFHEQCVDQIFADLLHFCRPEKLCVYARYTRRGGLDINPWRATGPDMAPDTQGRLVRQ